MVFGKASGFASSIELSALDGSDGFQINGVAERDFSGRSLAGAGDINGDGFADLIVGAGLADAGGKDSGASYIIYGSKPGEAASRTGTAIANTIRGGNDILIGGPAPTASMARVAPTRLTTRLHPPA